MIRQISTKDITSLSVYLAQKLNISLSSAKLKAKKIVKSGLPAFLLEGKDLQGVCWVESRLIGEKKEKFIEILCNNWRIAENYLQILRWNLDGIYYLSVLKHDFLNRTYNKNGLRFLKVSGDKNIYIYKFERRQFFNYKSEDADAN